MRTGCSKAFYRKTVVLLLSFFIHAFSHAQYILNGNATQNTCNCYQLTQQELWQSGSVWNSVKINLNTPFDFSFNVYLGCLEANGADGIVFMLQPLSTSLGIGGGGMGFDGVSPSIGITLDTWQNTWNNDPAYDHISIQANGNPTHGSDLAGPVTAANGIDNIEDCQWHVFRISWDPVTKWIRAYFDGSLRVEAQVDLIATIFNNNPMVYWGFSAATGGASNLQQFCTALNPDFRTNIINNITCIGNPVIFQDQSVSFAPIQSWYWDFGDGTNSTLQNPPQHLYAIPGIYEVKLVIRGFDGCLSDTLRKKITIGSKPTVNFQVFDTCFKKPPRLNDLSTNAVGVIDQWTWLLDGSFFSNDQRPSLANIPVGSHQLKLAVKSIYGCASDTFAGSFIIKPIPFIDLIAPDGCQNVPIQFTGTQLDNNTTITRWNWNFGDGRTSSQQNPLHSFSTGGDMTIHLTAKDNTGCVSDDVFKTIRVTQVSVTSINDTIVLPNIPFSLNTTLAGNYAGTPTLAWSPATGLSTSTGISPVATLQDDITYIITATTPEGCSAKDTIIIEVFKGSAIYVPNAFTPNKDGRNDLLRPRLIGIRQLDFFRVYNRWGQLVFTTNTRNAGWDGTINGLNQPMGVYVWMIKAKDVVGKAYEMKGTTTLIR